MEFIESEPFSDLADDHLGDTGRGKSGGARVIYYHRNSRNMIFFLAMYPKNQKADLSSEDRDAIRELVAVIKEEYP